MMGAQRANNQVMVEINRIGSIHETETGLVYMTDTERHSRGASVWCTDQEIVLAHIG